MRNMPDNIPYEEVQLLELKDYASDLLHHILNRMAVKNPSLRDQL